LCPLKHGKIKIVIHSFRPVNGIQCNTYADWMENGRLNDYNVVWTPLSRDLVKNFNDTAAWQFVEEHMVITYVKFLKSIPYQMVYI